MSLEATRLDYDDCDRILYIGLAQDKSQNDVTLHVWRIQKIYNAPEAGCEGLQDRIMFANGEDLFNKRWDRRTTYTY